MEYVVFISLLNVIKIKFVKKRLNYCILFYYRDLCILINEFNMFIFIFYVYIYINI